MRRAWDWSRPLRGVLGSAARAGAFGATGRAIGNVSGYLGTGDYTVDNAIVGQGQSSAGIPSFGPHHSEYRVSKCEFLQDIYAPRVAGAFQNTVLPIQPGLQESFPWLGLVAPQFEEYEMVQLMYYWRPMVTDFNSGTGQCGEIIMVTQYNPSDQPFIDTLRAKSYDMSMSTKTSIPMNHGVECAPSLNSGAPGKYVRIGPLTGGEDLKQYDLGNLNVIVTGTPDGYSGQKLGELWCAYTVILRKPKLPQTTGALILRDYFSSSLSPNVTESNVASWTGDPLAYLATDLVQAPMLYGAQNRLHSAGDGLNVTASAEGITFRYTFPTWYTGSIRMKVRMNGFGPCILSNHAGTSQGWTRSSAFSSNITYIEDQAPGKALMYIQAPPPLPLPQNCNSTVVALGDTGDTSIAIMSLYSDHNTGQIFAVTNNIEFEASLYVAAAQGGAASTWQVSFVRVSEHTGVYEDTPLRLASWVFDASEYNDSFNDPSTGRVQVVDSSGNHVASPWT